MQMHARFSRADKLADFAFSICNTPAIFFFFLKFSAWWCLVNPLRHGNHQSVTIAWHAR